MDRREYRVGESTISIAFGNLTESTAEVLVSSDDYILSMGGGVSRSILLAGGQDILRHSKKLTPLEAGDVAVTTAGGLPAKYIVHAVSIGRRHLDQNTDRDSHHGAIVRTATRRALDLVPRLGCQSIAFPLLGTGVAGISQELAANEMAGTMLEFLMATKQPIHVELRLMSRFGDVTPSAYFTVFEKFARAHYGLSTHGAGGTVTMEPPVPEGSDPESGADPEAVRRQEVFEIIQHLDARRRKLEAEMVEALLQGAPLDEIHRKLQQIEQLRSSYRAEATSGGSPRSTADPRSVFVSSTFEDMRAYREAARSVIEKHGFGYVGMEDFGAAPAAPADVIREKVLQSGHYYGIIGPRYGYVEPSSGLSMTELEYHQARTSGIPVHIFVMDESAAVPLSMVESDPDKMRKLQVFRTMVMSHHTCAKFASADDLARKVEITLVSPGL